MISCRLGKSRAKPGVSCAGVTRGTAHEPGGEVGARLWLWAHARGSTSVRPPRGSERSGRADVHVLDRARDADSGVRFRAHCIASHRPPPTLRLPRGRTCSAARRRAGFPLAMQCSKCDRSAERARPRSGRRRPQAAAAMDGDGRPAAHGAALCCMLARRSWCVPRMCPTGTATTDDAPPVRRWRDS